MFPLRKPISIPSSRRSEPVAHSLGAASMFLKFPSRMGCNRIASIASLRRNKSAKCRNAAPRPPLASPPSPSLPPSLACLALPRLALLTSVSPGAVWSVFVMRKILRGSHGHDLARSYPLCVYPFLFNHLSPSSLPCPALSPGTRHALCDLSSDAWASGVCGLRTCGAGCIAC